MPTCTQPQCKIATGGPCLEGQGPKCPHLQPDPSEVTSVKQQGTEESIPTEVAQVREPYEYLYPGTKLTFADANSFFYGFPCQVVVVAGLKDGGKTTFLSKLHQYFQQGVLPNFSFAGSKSLLGFSLIGWNSKAGSGLDEEDTERSKPAEDKTFLHLCVRSSTSHPKIHLLLNDITGETFKNAAANQTRCEELEMLRRADHVLLFLDGDALSQPLERQVPFKAVRDFLKMAIQTRQVGLHTVVHIVVSKLDKIESVGASALNFVAEKEQSLSKEFADQCGKFYLWRICARPDKGSKTVESRETIAAIFKILMEESEQRTSRLAVSRPSSFARDFCAFSEGAKL